MATASSNLVRLRTIKQAVFGTIPTTGSSTDLRFTSESLNFAISKETSQEIRADRQISDLIETGAEVSGDINFELSYGSFDDLIAGALGSNWVPDGSDTFDTVKNGTTVPFWAIEQGFTDVGQYILYRDMAVNSASFEFAVDAIATGTFSFMGSVATRNGATSLPAAGPQSTTEVMNTVSGFADLTIDGVAYPCGISRVTLTTNAGLRAQRGLGNLAACAINPGTFSVTGEITAYFQNGEFYDKYISNESVSLSWTMSDSAGNSYTFTLPKVKISEATVNAGGLDQDVELTLSYQALYDADEQFTIQVSRTPATP